MHPQMQRLYKAAQELKNVTGQSAVAKLLGATAQTVHNWEQRGMSKQGMVTAQRVIGCSASWLETGTGSMSINTMGNVVSAPRSPPRRVFFRPNIGTNPSNSPIFQHGV